MKYSRLWTMLLLLTSSSSLVVADMLSDAISGENISRVTTLIEDFGVDVNKGQIVDNQTLYPLFLATKTGNRELVKLLLAHGANVDQVNLVSGTDESTSSLIFEATALSYSTQDSDLLPITYLLLGARANPWVLLHEEARWLTNFETYKSNREMKITLLDTALFYQMLLFGNPPAKFSITYPNDDFYTYLQANAIDSYKQLLLSGHKPSDFEVALLIRFGNTQGLMTLQKLGYWTGEVDVKKVQRVHQIVSQFDTYFSRMYDGVSEVFMTDEFGKELEMNYPDMGDILTYLKGLPATTGSEEKGLNLADLFFPGLKSQEESFNFIVEKFK